MNNNAQYDSQDRLINNNSVSFTYTERGTLLTRTENNQTTSYNYDLMGNLLSVTLPNSTEIEYITDARNRRIAKKVNGIVVQKFLYLNQLEPIAELDNNDNIVSLFVYGTRSNTPDYIVKNNVKYKIVTNQLGSVVMVVNTTNGTIEQSIEHDSFGNILSDSNPNFQPFTLAGGIYDNDTQLTRFGARDYDARDGRWTSKDPIKFDGGRNFYSYCNGDPINRIDINGLYADFNNSESSSSDALFDFDFWVEYSKAFIDAMVGMGDFSIPFTNKTIYGLGRSLIGNIVGIDVCYSPTYQDAYNYGRYGAYVIFPAKLYQWINRFANTYGRVNELISEERYWEKRTLRDYGFSWKRKSWWQIWK